MRIIGSRHQLLLLVVGLAAAADKVQGYLTQHPSSRPALMLRKDPTLRIPRPTALEARRKGKGLDQELAANNQKSSAANWTPLPDALSPAAALPSEPDKVAFLDTRLPSLTNPATNPTGAVAVVRHGSKTYCFTSSCPSCKVPLGKARVAEREGAVVLSCDFCAASYDLTSGARVAPLGGGGGFFSGAVSKLLEKNPQSAGPLRVYQLGQVGGKLVIALD